MDYGVEKICGIYCIENTINNKRYIGQSADIENRWRTHRRLLNGNKHDNDYLQKAWNKYGEENFEFKILEQCTKEELGQMESKYIEMYKTLNRDHGYNLQSGGNSQYYLSETTKQKISQSRKGKYCGINNPNYGKPVSEETKEKIRKANTNPSEETREKMRKARLGTKASDETKRKMSEARSGEKNPNYGKLHSEETKQKLSEFAKERFKNPEDNPMYGKHHTEEAKKAMSIKRKKENLPIKTREKMSSSAKARCTDEWRQEMSKQLKGKFIGNKNPNAKYVYQYSSDWNLIKIWDTVNDVASEFGVNKSTVSGTWLKNSERLYRGFYWSLINIETLQNYCEVQDETICKLS